MQDPEKWHKYPLSDPSEWFVRDVVKNVYDGRATDKVMEQFTALTKKSFGQVISDMITDRLKNALREEQAVQPTSDVRKCPVLLAYSAIAASVETRI